MVTNRYATQRHSARLGHFWCNVCQTDCASDEALRQHYREAHPELAAQFEKLRAELGGAGPKTEDERRRTEVRGQRSEVGRASRW
jgi:hypothetical protein